MEYKATIGSCQGYSERITNPTAPRHGGARRAMVATILIVITTSTIERPPGKVGVYVLPLSPSSHPAQPLLSPPVVTMSFPNTNTDARGRHADARASAPAGQGRDLGPNAPLFVDHPIMGGEIRRIVPRARPTTPVSTSAGADLDITESVAAGEDSDQQVRTARSCKCVSDNERAVQAGRGRISKREHPRLAGGPRRPRARVFRAWRMEYLPHSPLGRGRVHCHR